MGHYKSNLRDIEFNLFEVFGRDEVLGQGPYEAVDTWIDTEGCYELALYFTECEVHE